MGLRWAKVNSHNARLRRSKYLIWESVRPRTVLHGQVRSGQVRSGQVRSGQVRSGQTDLCVKCQITGVDNKVLYPLARGASGF